jgi:hypothetical protein
MTRIGGPPAAADADEQQDLVTGVDQRVNALRQHRRAAREGSGDELRQRDHQVGAQRADHGQGLLVCVHARHLCSSRAGGGQPRSRVEGRGAAGSGPSGRAWRSLRRNWKLTGVRRNDVRGALRAGSSAWVSSSWLVRAWDTWGTRGKTGLTACNTLDCRKIAYMRCVKSLRGELVSLERRGYCSDWVRVPLPLRANDLNIGGARTLSVRRPRAPDASDAPPGLKQEING